MKKPEEIFDRVIGDHIIVEISTFEYSGVIEIPDTAKRSPTKGKVLMVGSDVSTVKPGELVLYSQFAGYPLQFQGATLMRIMSESEIIAVLKEGAPEIKVD